MPGGPTVRTRLAFCLIVSSFLTIPETAAAQDQIAVDAASIVADVSRKPIGINLNFLLDDDANRSNAVQRLAEALKQAGVKYLRYPGGEKSDAYLWSVPPYTRPQPTLARWAAGEYPQNQEWPSYDRALVESDGHTFRTAPLDFDEFMAICREIGCVPTVVVCYDSMYKPAQTDGVAPSREQLLETAREWVRYANVVKDYDVKYWEIGNESYLAHYNGGATASNYARDLIDFSREMKSVDPTILIGANGDAESWWQTVLSTAAGAIDFLAVHNYPSSTWQSYSDYQNNSVNLMAAVQTAQRAIGTYAPAVDRSRLVVASTEINSAAWTGGWPHVNDMGHALALFDEFGAHLINPGVAFTQLWNTRWSGNDTATTPALWDAVDKYNQLQATGRATAIWGQFLKEKIVAASNTAKVRAYATLSPANGRLSVFLINKDTVARSASVTVSSGSPSFVLDTWVFSGHGADDLYPTWAQTGRGSKTGPVVSLTLAPVSVTVLDLAPDGSTVSIPGTLQAEDFGSALDSTTGNAGRAYRSTDVDIEPTSDAGEGFDVGWISAGEWLDYAVSVAAGGSYDVSVRVASPYSGKSFSILVDGADVSGAIPVPKTGGWQNWRTVTRPSIVLAAGTHRVTVKASTDGFNLNWLSIIPAPAIIEAEDFQDGAYWDSTTANLGGAYRVSGVDIQPTTDTGGGFNVGWIAANEWLDYVIQVPTGGGYYDLSSRVASPLSGKSFRVLVNGIEVTGSTAVPNTGGWQNWQTVTSPRIFLTGGAQRLRLVAITDGFNVNWIALRPSP